MGSPPPRRRRGFDSDPGRRARLAGAVRGQSTTLEYTLSLAIAALVLTGLFAAAGDFVTDRRQEVVRTELNVIGQHLANEVVSADRLVQSGERTERLSINTSMPSSIAGTQYSVSVTERASGKWMNLTAEEPDVTVAVRFETVTDVEQNAIDGGDFEVRYDPAADQLEVRG